MRSKADFKRMNGDEESVQAQMNKWGVAAFPTLVMTDSSGKALNSMRGAPQSPDEFQRWVEDFLAKHG